MSNKGKSDRTHAIFKTALAVRDEDDKFSKDQIPIEMRYGLCSIVRTGFVKKAECGRYQITKEGIRYAKLQVW